MGARLVSEILNEALLEAGDASLTSRALVWLNDWLSATYKACDWPFLRKTVEGVALASGNTALLIGGGSGGVTNPIKQVLSPLRIYDSGSSVDQEVHARSYTGLRRGVGRTGVPTVFQISAGATWGNWSLRFEPTPDRALLLDIPYIDKPANVTAANTPIYPEDRTMGQAVIHKALAHLYGPSSREALEAAVLLASMAKEDRVKFGIVTGFNDSIPLDPRIFRRRIL